MTYEELLRQGIRELKQGKTEAARQALQAITQVEPTNEMAWLWYAYSYPDEEQSIAVLRQCLEVNPDSEECQKRLDIYLARAQKTKLAQQGETSHRENGAEQSGATSDAQSPFVASMAQVRQDLLDLGLRNPLLNYRLLKSRGAKLDVTKPQQVYNRLVVEGRKLILKPLEEPDTENAASTQSHPQHANETHDQSSQRGVYTQTTHPKDELARRLLNTYYTARTHIEEQGVNVLFLAFGMLSWYETRTSDTQRLAPLVLVPVEISRTDVRSRFRITYSGEDVAFNLSLRAKLKLDFGLQLPELPESEEIDLRAYFRQVSQTIQRKPRWQVDDCAAALGFFSFGTLLMYNDLLEETWENVLPIAEHPIVRGLLGEGLSSAADTLPDDVFIDDIVNPADIVQVVDADSSQISALVNVKRGHSMIIQGPPGTGKSQTITNIIAQAIGSGQRVLFVAEKMAALEVVKRRLDKIGLGVACLEIHSQKTSKRLVVDELKRTMALGRPQVQDHTVDQDLLVSYRDLLNAYSRAVSTPIRQSGVTPYLCCGNLLGLNKTLDELEAPHLAHGSMPDWSRADYRKTRVTVNELQSLLNQIGVPCKHTFWGSQPPLQTPTARRSFVGSCSKAAESLSNLREVSNSLCEKVRSPLAGNPAQSRAAIAVAEHLLGAPELDSIDVRPTDWHLRRSEIRDAIDCAERLQELHIRHGNDLRDEAWEHRTETLHQTYSAVADKWWRLSMCAFREAKKDLRELCRGRLPLSFQKQLALIIAIEEAQGLRADLDPASDLVNRLFGQHWSAERPDWPHLRHTADWLASLHSDIAQSGLHGGVISYLADGINKIDLKKSIAVVQQATAAYEVDVDRLFEEIHLDEKRRFGDGNKLIEWPYEEQLHLLKTWRESADRLSDIVNLTHLDQELRSRQLPELAESACTWEHGAQFLADLYDRTWYEGLLEVALEEREDLARFDRGRHCYRLEEFRKLDVLQFRYNRARLALLHWSSLPAQDADGQVAVLRREFEKRRRYLPIRKLMERAGNAIQAIKPVFMMSPFSTAAYLPPGSVDFDLVVFDEASQVRPAEAFGAILRGSQVVVVGDSKQLPPTSFFQRMVESDEEDESPTADLESILGLFRVKGAPEQTLKWHYRSRHPSLIAVSNYEFYNNGLVVFPSPDDSRETLGLIYHHLPKSYYDRGKSRTNRVEARRVAQAVMHHAQRTPDLTLGVAAFSLSQTRAIQEELELLRQNTPEYESFFADHTYEPFFVKNLENVQGDERDVILISIGYGRSADGRLTMSFGPLNSDGGERRLNVLITRARQRCEVFSNITGDDIDTSKTQARGVITLKRFLSYAETGNIDIPTFTGQEPDSIFEEEVMNALQHLGYQIVPQVGSAGFRIDLAVKDELHPGRYILGIECDGASYHSARSARDRDRLRQEVLEGLGWRIHRIWSTDWFKHEDREMERLVAAITDARSRSALQAALEPTDPKPAASKEPSETIRRAEVTKPRSTASSQLYKPFSGKFRCFGPLHKAPRHSMMQWVEQVVHAESPIHNDELVRRITHCADVGRSGSRIKAAVLAGARQLGRAGKVSIRGSFVWESGMTTPPVRDRSKLPMQCRKIELIAPEEVAEAIRVVVRGSLGIELGEIPPAALSKLGFKRAGPLLVNGVEAVVDTLLTDGTLVLQNGYIVLAGHSYQGGGP